MSKVSPDDVYRFLHNSLPADYPIFLKPTSIVNDPIPHPGSQPVKSRKESVTVDKFNDVFAEFDRISKIPGVTGEFTVQYYEDLPERDIEERDWVWNGTDEYPVTNIKHYPARVASIAIRFQIDDPDYDRKIQSWNDKVKGHQQSIQSRQRKVEANKEIVNKNRQITDDARNKNIELWRFVAKELGQGHVPDLTQYKREMLLRQLAELEASEAARIRSLNESSIPYPAGYDTHSRHD